MHDFFVFLSKISCFGHILTYFWCFWPKMMLFSLILMIFRRFWCIFCDLFIFIGFLVKPLILLYFGCFWPNIGAGWPHFSYFELFLVFFGWNTRFCLFLVKSSFFSKILLKMRVLGLHPLFLRYFRVIFAVFMHFSDFRGCNGLSLDPVLRLDFYGPPMACN